MWWNLDIFGKFAFEIRMDYWYLWKTHFLNFRDFQESPNPLKIPIPTPASDFCTRCTLITRNFETKLTKTQKAETKKPRHQLPPQHAESRGDILEIPEVQKMGFP